MYMLCFSIKKTRLSLIIALLLMISLCIVGIVGCSNSGGSDPEYDELGANDKALEQSAVAEAEGTASEVADIAIDAAKERKDAVESGASDSEKAEPEANDKALEQSVVAEKKDTVAAAANKTDDTSEIVEWSITIEVLGEDPVEFTNKDAAAVGPVEIVAVEKDKDEFGDAQIWTGILLKDLLEYIGVTEFTVIAIVAQDGFMRELDMERMSEATGIGWMVNGEMLDAERGPIQLIADQRGPKWWIPQVAKIEIIK
jgi:hypothetical protein